MANYTDPIKAGFGQYLGRFYAQALGDTPGVKEWLARGFSRAAVWAPGRMVDQVEEMLATWRKNDNEPDKTKPAPYLPVIIAAMGHEYTPTPVEFGRPLADDVFVSLPADPLERVFRLKSAMSTVKIQVAIVAQDGPTARSIAMQIDSWCKQLANRRFHARYPLAGFDEPWPVVLEMPELLAVPVPQEVKNLVVLTVDISMNATVPMLILPAGAGADQSVGAGTDADPYGYYVVREARGFGHQGTMGDGLPREWIEENR